MGRNKGQNPGAFMCAIMIKSPFIFHFSCGSFNKRESWNGGGERKTFGPPFSAPINKMNEALSHPFML